MLIFKKIFLCYLFLITLHAACAMEQNHPRKRTLEEPEFDTLTQTKKQKQSPQVIKLWAGIREELNKNKRTHQLHLAALEGNLEKLEDLYENKKKFFIQHSNKQATSKHVTPLFCAVASGQLACVIFLIECGANKFKKAHFDASLLHTAAEGGHFEIVKWLINNGIDINSLSTQGSTPIIGAALAGQRECVSLLLDRGAQTNIQIVQGRTILHLLANSEHDEIAQLIIDKEKDVTWETTTNRQTPLHYAAITNNGRLARRLIEMCDVKATDNNGWTAMHTAAHFGSIDVAEEIIKKSSKIIDLATVHDYATPLHIAIKNKQTKFATWLIDNDANVKIPHSNGDTPMQLAIRYKDLDIAKKLYLEDISCIDGANHINGFTPLFYAVTLNDLDFITLLLDMGANITATTPTGWSILHAATTCKNHPALVIKTILAWIRSPRNAKIIKKFIDERLDYLRDTFKTTELFDSVKKEIMEIGELLLLCKQHALKNRTNEDYPNYNVNKERLWITSQLPKLVLHQITQFVFDPKEVIDYLLNMKNKEGKTPRELTTDDECIRLLTPRNKNN